MVRRYVVNVEKTVGLPSFRRSVYAAGNRRIL